MSHWKTAAGLVLVALLFAGIGYVFATAYVSYRIFGFNSLAQPDFSFIAANWPELRLRRPNDARTVQLIIGASAAVGLLLGAVLASEALTRFGQTRWQTKGDLKANGFFNAAGRSFVLAKTTDAKRKGAYLSSDRFPHCLVIAPTGRGKGVGFVIPNLLTYKGSTVTLDVKGENFLATSRHRQAQGDRVYRFAPTDWDRPTHRYNPLERIASIKNPAQQLMALQLTANLFLQSDNDRVSGLLDGGIDLFIAAGMLAFERGIPTLGEIYRIAASGGDKRVEYFKRSEEVRNPAAKLIFERLASTNNDTLTSYLSLLMTSGLKTWANPAIDAATAISDFSFRDIRRVPQSIYLVVEPEMIKPLAPLVRLFFSDLIASLQAKEPGKDEPWPVMIMLDEFDRLGKMPIVAESIKTLRSYGGNLAIVTQTIPALDEIYGENTRMSLQGGAGIKLYLTPSEPKTVEELSRAVGKTTKRVLTKSRSISANPFKGRSITERTEEVSLLPEDDARRMSLDDVVLVVDAQHPIRVKRIKYYDDPFFSKLFKAQTGPHPYPDGLRTSTDDLERTAKAQSGELAKLRAMVEDLSRKVPAAVETETRAEAKPAPDPDDAKSDEAVVPKIELRKPRRREERQPVEKLTKAGISDDPEVLRQIEAEAIQIEMILREPEGQGVDAQT